MREQSEADVKRFGGEGVISYIRPYSQDHSTASLCNHRSCFVYSGYIEDFNLIHILEIGDHDHERDLLFDNVNVNGIPAKCQADN